MTKLLHTLVLISLAFGSMAAAPPEPRKPTARWVINYDDAQCVASRNYGTDEKPFFLALKPSPTGSVMRIMLIRNGYAAEAEEQPALVRFDDKKAINASALAYSDRTTRRLNTAISLPMHNLTENRTARAIEIRGSGFSERLAVGGLGGVMAAFDDCLANLRNVWNIGAQSATRLKQEAQPKKPLRDLFRSSSYPTQAIRQHDTGQVGIALLIDETGKVRDCMIAETSGFATLDTMSCSILVQYAKFYPAIGIDGKPAKSASIHRIKWRIAA